jgi:soluble lytic murein transglycosylase-like protein
VALWHDDIKGSVKRPFVVGIVVLLAGISLSLRALPQDSSRKTYDPVIRKVAKKHGVEPELIHAIIRAESNYESTAVSPKGAVGLMQLMPATGKAYGVNNFIDPEENIEGGTKYLKDLIKLYAGKTSLVLAAYNAGQEAVKRYKGIPATRTRTSGPGPSSTSIMTAKENLCSRTIRASTPSTKPIRPSNHRR